MVKEFAEQIELTFIKSVNTLYTLDLEPPGPNFLNPNLKRSTSNPFFLIL